MLYVEKLRSLRTFLRLTIVIENEYLKNKGEPSDDFIYNLTKKYAIIRTDELFYRPNIFKCIEDKLNRSDNYTEEQSILFD